MSLDTSNPAEHSPNPRKKGHFLRRNRVAQLGEAGLGLAVTFGGGPFIFVGGAFLLDGVMRMFSYEGKGFIGQATEGPRSPGQ